MITDSEHSIADGRGLDRRHDDNDPDSRSKTSHNTICIIRLAWRVSLFSDCS